jgi:hypothetical protein
MNRAQLEHIIRASGEIAGVQDVIILGSQAILGQFPDLGDPLFKSGRVDISLKKRSQKIIGRQKDIEFFHAAIQLQIITKEILLERLDMTPISDVHKERIQCAIEGGFHSD